MDPISAIFTKIIGTMLGAIIGTIAPAPQHTPKPERAAITNTVGTTTTQAKHADRKRRSSAAHLPDDSRE
jgi:hypothetical protein